VSFFETLYYANYKYIQAQAAITFLSENFQQIEAIAADYTQK